MASRLPADPLLGAVDRLCAARSLSPRQALGPAALHAAYLRAGLEGSLTLSTVERFCAGPLKCDPHDLYGEQYDRAIADGSTGRGADTAGGWLEDFRRRATTETALPPTQHRTDGVAEVVPAEELSGRRARQLGDQIVDNLGDFLDATGHGQQLRALLGPAADQLLGRDDRHGPDCEISG